MKNKKGFTLVEILAVVVILGVIVLIATNIVLKHVKNSKEQAFIVDVQQFVKSTSYETLVKDKIDEYVIYTFPNSGIDVLSKDADSGYMIKDENDNVRISIWNNSLKACATKGFNEGKVKIDENIKTEKECNSFLNNIKTGDQISVKNLTGEDVNFNLKASCYTLDENDYLDSFNTSECGTVLVIPNKVNGVNVKGISENFVENQGTGYTALYMIAVDELEDTTVGFLGGNLEIKKAVVALMPKLSIINSGFVSPGSGNHSNIETLFIYDNPKLETITGVLSTGSSDLAYLTLEKLPKLATFNSCFQNSKIEKIVIDNLDSLTSMAYGTFSNNNGDAEVIINGNDNLSIIESGILSGSGLKKLKITNNNSLVSITNGTFMGNLYIDELEIANNPELTTINNGSFAGYEYNTIKLYNLPNLINIQYSAFNNIKANVFDISGLNITTLDLSTAFMGASIDKIILPSTLTTIDASALNSIVKEKIEFGGSDKCSLINLFRTGSAGSYNYLVDQNKLPSCP